MVLVVFQHVRLFVLDLPLESSPFALFFIEFRMPMFFFISGYIAYKSRQWWNFENYSRRILTKARVQLIPTIVFYSIFAYLQVHNWTFPGGFWFTLVLFEMFFIYFSTALCLKRFNHIYEWIVLLTISGLLFYLKFKVSYFPYIKFLCLEELGSYYIFFVFGLFARCFKEKFNAFCNNKIVMFVGVFIPLLLLLLQYGPFHMQLRAGLTSLVKLVNGYLLIIVIFSLFRTKAEYWAKDGVIQNSTEYIGRRTLDIYMIHYFLIPAVPSLHEWLASFNSYVIEFVVCTILSLIVVGLCLMISAFLRQSSIISEYLFGVKNPKKTIKESC